MDGLTGTITNIQLGDNTTLEQDFWYYTSYAGNNEEFRNRSSGAYIFRPYGRPIMINPQPKIKGYKGTLLCVLNLLKNFQYCTHKHECILLSILQ